VASCKIVQSNPARVAKVGYDTNIDRAPAAVDGTAVTSFSASSSKHCPSFHLPTTGFDQGAQPGTKDVGDHAVIELPAMITP
jgi:hypothetical protein